MSGEDPIAFAARAKSGSYGVRLWWTCGTALGTLIGAIGALTFFPGAAFGANPTGQFGWHLVGFASLVGASLGVSQWAILRCLLKPKNATNRLLLHLWMPITTVGIMATLMPLWWQDAAVLVFLPFMSAALMIPGTVFMGIAQQLILRRLISASLSWVQPTMVGMAIGSTLGLIAWVVGAILFFSDGFLAGLLMGIPIDLPWSFITGLFLGFFQARALAMNLSACRRRENLRP